MRICVSFDALKEVGCTVGIETTKKRVYADWIDKMVEVESSYPYVETPTGIKVVSEGMGYLRFPASNVDMVRWLEDIGISYSLRH